MNQNPVHPPLPFGLGSQITLTGLVGAVVTFITSIVQNGLDDPGTITYGATAAGLLAVFFAGRSVQAKGAIESGIGAYLGGADEGDEASNQGPDGGPLVINEKK